MKKRFAPIGIIIIMSSILLLSIAKSDNIPHLKVIEVVQLLALGMLIGVLFTVVFKTLKPKG